MLIYHLTKQEATWLDRPTIGIIGEIEIDLIEAEIGRIAERVQSSLSAQHLGKAYYHALYNPGTGKATVRRSQ